MKNLAQLAIQGDYDQVRQLATSQLVKAKDASGRTAFMLASDVDGSPYQLVKCLEYLMHLGADPLAADTAGDTAAHLAARRDHLRLLAMLPFEAKWKQNVDDLNPLMEAARAGSWKCVKHLIHLLRQERYNLWSNKVRMELLGKTSKNGQTALDLARQNGHMDIARIIEL